MAAMKITETFRQQLQSLWSIESMLVEAMPRLIKKAGNFGLQKSLAFHLAETDQHKVAIEAICKVLDTDPGAGEPDMELQGILQEGEKAMMETSGDAMDAAIIAAAREIERYEMTVYGPAADTAEALGYEGIAKRLRLTLEEEQQAHTKLGFLEGSLFRERAEIGQAETIRLNE